MKPLKTIGLFVLIATNLMASECCLGGGARSLNSLQAMQRYDFGLTTSFQDYSSWYNLSLQAYSAIRLTPHLEVFGRVPVVQHKVDYGTKRESQTRLGDLSVGLRMTLMRSLFVEDVHPTVSLVMAAKVPTEGRDFQQSNLFQTRSGNGLLEPLVGVSFSKEYYDWQAMVDFSYLRLRGSVLDKLIEDNQINATATVGYALNREWHLGVGGNQMWSTGRRINNESASDAPPRDLSFFSYVNYFFTQFASVGAHLDWSAPNSRSASLSLRYGFY
ncbi:MAG: hypothetical protein EBQ92_06695 [Proteobacteria bacterium]|nr:hypothetical protein [Pseudomonadota bacterium]